VPTLLDKICEESRTSIEVVRLLLEMTTFLEELPPSTWDDKCPLSGSIIPLMPPCINNPMSKTVFTKKIPTAQATDRHFETVNFKNKVLCPIVSIKSNLSLRDLDPTGNMNCKKIILFAFVSSSPGLLCFFASVDPKGRAPIESLQQLSSAALTFHWMS
jgi:hypothetical protein